MKLSAVMTRDKARIAITPPATLRCAMAEAVANWVRDEAAGIAKSLGAPLGGIANVDPARQFQLQVRLSF